jgi:hypothetical protein
MIGRVVNAAKSVIASQADGFATAHGCGDQHDGSTRTNRPCSRTVRPRAHHQPSSLRPIQRCSHTSRWSALTTRWRRSRARGVKRVPGAAASGSRIPLFEFRGSRYVQERLGTRNVVAYRGEPDSCQSLVTRRTRNLTRSRKHIGLRLQNGRIS